MLERLLHPFNEYLLIMCEHGFAGLIIVLLLGFFLIRAYRHNPNDVKLAAVISLSALAVFSIFSYPFRYPFTWVILFLNVAVIYKAIGIIPMQKSSVFTKIYPRIIRIILFSCLLVCSVILAQAEITWKRLARFSWGNVLPEYDKLYRWLGKDGLFLYNHAAELHKAKDFEKSNAVFKQCTLYHNDMDVQMLLADNYKELEKYTDAEQHLKTAAAMCPVRFMPLYELVKLYDATDRKGDALAMAKKIIDKDIKVPSPTIDLIKKEMSQLIEVLETLNVPENDNWMSDEPEKDKTRQGETPEIPSHGAALPP